MKLTLEGLIDAIQSARRLERLQSDLRDALIAKLIGVHPSEVPENPILPGAPIQ